MDLSLTQEHEMVAKMVRDFAEKEVAPVIKEHDREQKHIPWVFKRLGELGILGICLPVKLGGAGMDYISLGLACEELERVDTSLRVILSVHVGLNSLALFQWGNEEQKEKYLVPQATGDKIATYALTEPGAAPTRRASAPRPGVEGDRYILNGEKMWISLADVADQFLIIAKTEPEKRHKGMSGLYRRAGLSRRDDRDDSRQAGRAGGQYRLYRAARRRGAGCQSPGRRRRRVHDCDERAGQWPLHGGGRRDGPDSRLSGSKLSSTRRSARRSGKRSPSTNWCKR